MPKLLIPPQNPKEAIESRRKPCYGFCVLADIQDKQPLITLLSETRDAVLNIIDPDRATKQRPVRSPEYIKQKFFHAAVFGMQPLLEEKEYVEIYANEKGELNRDRMDKMCETLHTHLTEKKPYLEPVKCELMNHDGTILARFAYKTTDLDDAPLLTLTSQLDPEKQFSKWDSNNRMRYTTVAVAICVIDKDKMADKLEAIAVQLALSSEKLKQLGKLDVNQFQLIDSYNKRTLSLNHITMYASISKDQNNKVCRKK